MVIRHVQCVAVALGRRMKKPDPRRARLILTVSLCQQARLLGFAGRSVTLFGFFARRASSAFFALGALGFGIAGGTGSAFFAFRAGGLVAITLAIFRLALGTSIAGLAIFGGGGDGLGRIAFATATFLTFGATAAGSRIAAVAAAAGFRGRGGGSVYRNFFLRLSATE